MELTDKRAKPAVHFGGKLRIIDFALSNALNSGIRHLAVATQYKAHSLIRHLQRGWNFLRPERNESFDILPASQRVSEDYWYRGTADAVFQNIDIIASYKPEFVIVLAGDHVYKMDYEPMLQQHVSRRADVTVGCIAVPRAEARTFGVMHVDSDGRIVGFLEKPHDPPGMPGNPDFALASMGIYAFETRFLLSQLERDASDPRSSHDFGKDIIPFLVRGARAVAHPFEYSCIRADPERPVYWRDVGTLDAYFTANIDLTEAAPDLDLYDRNWPIWTYSEMTPPAKFVHGVYNRQEMVESCLIAGGSVVAGAAVSNSLLFSRVHVDAGSDVRRSVILPEVEIGRDVRLRNVIVDRGACIPDRLVVGEDPQLDSQRFRRTEAGVCLITQGMLDRLGA
jgi:glucose-1-phosphate adenylyltransferase